MFEISEGEAADAIVTAVTASEIAEAADAEKIGAEAVAENEKADDAATSDENPAETGAEGEDGEDSGREDADGVGDDSEADTDTDTDGDDSEAGAEEALGENGVSPLPLTSVVEALLFAAREPLKPVQLARAAGRRIRQNQVRDAVAELNVHYLETGRAFEIAEISGRFQLMSRPEYAEQILRIYPKKELGEKERKERLTPAALDTLAIIAYKQPVMRSEIEHIRGVACGPMLKTLIERGTVREVGRRTDLVGKPALFGTTERFLIEFGLGSLEELPLRNEFASFAGFKMESSKEKKVEITPAPLEKPLVKSPENAEEKAEGPEEKVPEPAEKGQEAEIAVAPEERPEDNGEGEAG